MKYAVSFFIVLCFVVSGLLFFQFQVYSDKLETGEGEFLYSQEIEISYNGESLDIRQHFKNLPNQTIDIKWPNLAVYPDCFLESEQSCERLSDDKSKFEVGEERFQSLSYIIPLEGGLKSKQLLKDIFASLNNGSVTYTTVHVSTNSNVAGQWITGLPLIGQQSLNLVNYTMFSGDGDVREIYWQSEPLKLQQSTDLVTIYSNSNLDKQFHDKFKNIHFLNEEHISIVHGANLTNEQGERILFVNDISIEGLNQNILQFQVKSLYDFGNSPAWVSEVVSAFLTGTVSGDGKVDQVVNTLMSKMSDSQLELWLQKLDSLKGEKISSTVLDQILTEIFGSNLRFFALNETVEGIYPFVFVDDRNIIYEKKFNEDMIMFIDNGLTYYPADEILKFLGYEASIGDNGYYVNNESRSFRFPDGYDFYVYNQQRYDTISSPFTFIAGTRYIEESWLQRLFSVDIEKTTNEIVITPVQ